MTRFSRSDIAFRLVLGGMLTLMICLGMLGYGITHTSDGFFITQRRCARVAEWDKGRVTRTLCAYEDLNGRTRHVEIEETRSMKTETRTLEPAAGKEFATVLEEFTRHYSVLEGTR